MARSRKASSAQKKLSMICFGEQFTGKSTFASQFAYMHNEDGTPMRVLFIDCESGSIDDYLDTMEDNGVDLDNILIYYTQSLGEVLDLVNKVTNNEDFYMFDEDGEETDEVALDADGKPFRADCIVIDGVSVLYTAAQQGLLEFSKKRARVRADGNGLVGEERLVAIEGSSMEQRDWGSLKYKGSNLCLSLLGTGVHHIITCREDDEKIQVKTSEGKTTSVPTGRKIPMGFKGDLEYNMKTVIRFYRDDDDNVVADVRKDRSGVHPREQIVDPSLLDWQSVIDGNKGKDKFVLKNSLDTAVETEQEIYSAEVMSNATKSMSKSDMEKSKAAAKSTSAVSYQDIINQINPITKAMSPTEVQEMKKKLTDAGLPTNYKKVTDAAVLQQILDIVSA